MLFNHFVEWEVAKARQSEMLKEAESARLLEQARAGRPRLLNSRLALKMLGAAAPAPTAEPDERHRKEART